MGAALGVGSLVAGLVTPSSSPFLAVGDTVIRLSPQVLTEFAKTTFGTADKPVLLGGMAVVIALVGAVAGLVSRRRPGPGLTVVAVLGLLGVGAVAAAPTVNAAAFVAPLAALVAGLASFAGLHRVARSANGEAPTDGSGGDSGRGGIGRRAVLVGSMAAVAVASAAAGLGGLLLGGGGADSRRGVTARLAGARVTEQPPAVPAGADFAELGTPGFLTPAQDFYRIDTALQVPDLRAEDWSLRLHGMVDRELSLSFDDLLSRPLVERTITMTCVSNPVGGDLISTAVFTGVDLRELLLEAGVQRGADQIFTTSSDGWTAGTPTDVVLEPGRGALLAVGMNGEALLPEHGFPVRMVVPGLYGFVSATKWLVDMELTTFDRRKGYWLQRGWAQRAPIKTECRIDSPRGFQSVPAGRVTCAGIAWSQPIGISKVEVRMDGGPWRAATLSSSPSGATGGRTWRMWKADFDLAPGSHTVQTRAVDANGVTQTEDRAEPIPDGASGWPATIFTVS
ncbi:molybdopterin-dependent oxidoreductase [Pseudonocardia ailaonensis]|uniref:Molybdopterin-dependent oxidoreductase n=1 Tax=Pseudonocardia ailaonensis TaxID=367279 RepID=A0ABN2NPK0_9PSEU